MREVFWHPDLELPQRPRVVALGAFDGMHRGHESTIGRMRALAREAHAEATVLTFDPSPREFVEGVRQPGRRLTTVREQMCRLGELGVDLSVVIEFPGNIREIEPEDFVRDVLVGQLSATCVCASESHRFGRGGRGDLALLRMLGEQQGFEVVVIQPVVAEGERISSTRIRDLLAAGEVTPAAALLGRPYPIIAAVMAGHGMGTKLGFPTANLRIPPEKLVPADGVYAGWAGRTAGECARMDQPRPGAIHIGPAPTLGRDAHAVEVHLVGEHCDLLGVEIRVEFLRRLRESRAFPSREALIEQIGRDVVQTARIAAETGPWCTSEYLAQRPPPAAGSGALES